MVSGGVDSTVCAALLHKALDDSVSSTRVIAVHIDNGFMRHRETEKVMQSLQDIGLRPHGGESANFLA